MSILIKRKNILISDTVHFDFNILDGQVTSGGKQQNEDQYTAVHMYMNILVQAGFELVLTTEKGLHFWYELH